MKLIQIKQKDLKHFRKRILKVQKGICPILKLPLVYEDSVVDHLHKRKAEVPGIDNKGCVRGIIHRFVNAFEGSIYKKYIRSGLAEAITLPELLRNLADYIENPPMFTRKLRYIHPKEEMKEKKKDLGILAYNRVLKYWGVLHPKRNVPLQSKSGKITKKWQEYIDEANAYHENITGKKLKRK